MSALLWFFPRMPKAPVLFLASTLSLAGSSREPAGGQAASAVAPAPAAPAARPAGLADLAAARALHARLARLAWPTADLQLSRAGALAEVTRLRAQAAR